MNKKWLVSFSVLLLSTFILLPSISTSKAENSRRTIDKSQSFVENFSQIPVRFEENKGQFPKHIKYALKSPRYTAFVTRKGLMVANQRIKQNPIDIEFYGSSDQVAKGVDMVSGKVNYMMGNDKDKWIKNIPLLRK